jgi:hypothetical protein
LGFALLPGDAFTDVTRLVVDSHLSVDTCPDVHCPRSRVDKWTDMSHEPWTRVDTVYRFMADTRFLVCKGVVCQYLH